MMKAVFLLFIVGFTTIFGYSQKLGLVKGHAHNDYENENPLFDAIKNGFISVEADVHLIEGELYVTHDTPHQLNAALTLDALYLKPLKELILRNKGAVYKDYSGPFYLMIDFKTNAKPTYKKLKKNLSQYLSIITFIKNGKEQGGPVKIVVSGNRPINDILYNEPKIVGLDGRPGELNQKISMLLMPIVSDYYYNILTWNGKGEIPLEDTEKLINLVSHVHAQNKKLRLWGAPDTKNTWKFLLDYGVDLINTDHLVEFNEFYINYKQHSE